MENETRYKTVMGKMLESLLVSWIDHRLITSNPKILQEQNLTATGG